MNVFSQLKILKEKISHNSKFIVFTAIFPLIGLVYFTHTIYKFKLFKYFTGENVFNNFEEKQIGKKIYPIMKYKNIEKIYENNFNENQIITRVYDILMKKLKLNLKPEIFLIKSDVIFF